MAQKVIETVLKSDATYANMREAFKKQIIKALGLLKDNNSTQDLKLQIKEILKSWEEKQLFMKGDISLMIETLDPTKISKDKMKSQFAPP